MHKKCKTTPPIGETCRLRLSGKIDQNKYCGKIERYCQNAFFMWPNGID